MYTRSHRFEKVNTVFLPDISRILVIYGLFFLYIEFVCVPALAQSVEYHDGYNIISYDDGSKDVISGALNFLRWDNVWRPRDELNSSNGSWPYFISENATTAGIKTVNTALTIPASNAEFNLKENSISYSLKYSKSELLNEIFITPMDAFIKLPDLKSGKPKIDSGEEFNIKRGNFNFGATTKNIIIHDDTPRNYTEDGKEFQDVTYLFPNDYEYQMDNGQILLKFRENALDKLTGNVIIQFRTWDIIGLNNWGGNDVSFSQTADVKATGNVELRQMVDDYALYTRFDEGSENIIHNENTLDLIPTKGDLKGAIENSTYTDGKYGKAIHFNGIDNKVLFNDHPDFRLPYDFTISYYINLAPDVSNVDSDIIRKGSTATADTDSWWKIEMIENVSNYQLIHGSITNRSSAIESNDTVDRRDGNWHFVVYNRRGNSCSLMIDGSIQATSYCPTNATNTALLSIGSKDTYIQKTGLDFTHGTIDEVRIYNRKLNTSELTFVRNNSHHPAGTVTRNLSSLINDGEELKKAGCNGTWDRSITNVDIMASTNNNTWDTIRSNAIPNAFYSINPENNYNYIRCSLSTIDSSRTPIIESIRARIYPKGTSYTISISTSPPGLSPQPAGADEYPSGYNATVTARSVKGYTFQNWTENSSQVSTNPAYQFIVTGDRNLVAVYSQNIVSPAGWWKFDTDILDLSGNGNDGTCSGSGCPTPAAGKVAGALYFDGNDSIDAGNRASLNITGSITIEAWIKPEKLATSYIVKKASMGSTDGYELSLSSTGKAFFRVNQKKSGNTYRVDTISPLNNTTWFYLVGIYDGNQIRIYLNGQLDNSKKGPSNIMSNMDSLEIGGPDALAYFRGVIDEVRIWNRALTPQEIEGSYITPP